MARTTTITVNLTGDDIPVGLREEDGLPVEEVMAQIHQDASMGWGTMVLSTRGKHPDGRLHGRRKAHRYALSEDWATLLFRGFLIPRSLLDALR